MQCNLNLDEKTIAALDDMAARGGWSRSKVADMLLGMTLGVEGASVPDFFRFLNDGVKTNKSLSTEERAALVDG